MIAKRISRIVLCVSILCVFGCASSQPVMDRLGTIEMKQQTERSESVAEFQAIKNEIEAVKIRLDTVSKAQADLMASMDRQNELIQNAIEKMEYGNNSATIPVTRSDVPAYTRAESTDLPSEEPDQRPEVVYQTAYNDYINRNYDLAVIEFQNFLTAFPDSALADNAQYWIGECYYSQQRYEESLAEFNKVIQQYPEGDKFIPAMLKKGLSQIETGNIRNGKQILEKLVEDYPYSNEARIAQDRLDNP